MHVLECWGHLESTALHFLFIIHFSGMQNSIVTLFELTQGDDARNEEFYEMPQDMFVKILRVLERERKCELLLDDNNQGVKFF